MRLYLDCEYNGFGGELLSIALVGGYGNPFYRIVDDTTEIPTQWVRDNVMPALTAFPGHAIRATGQAIRCELGAFLRKYHKVHIVANRPEAVIHFCRLLMLDMSGKWMDTPPLTMSILHINARAPLSHNALANAFGLMLTVRNTPSSIESEAEDVVADA